MIFFCLPLLIAIFGGGKLYCNRYCDRGQFLSLLGGRLKLSRNRPTPRWMGTRAFRYGFLIFFFLMFFQMLWTTFLVGAGAQSVGEFVKLFWTFRLPWHWAYHGTLLAPLGGPVCLRVLQHYAHIHPHRPDRHGPVQAPVLVRVLPHGDHDPAHLPPAGGTAPGGGGLRRLRGVRGMNMDAMRRRAGAVAALMGQLSNENRLLILCALLERPMTVGELSAQVPPQSPAPPCPSTSTACGRGGLVQAEKLGQYVRYAICDPRLSALMEVLKREYCGD